MYYYWILFKVIVVIKATLKSVLYTVIFLIFWLLKLNTGNILYIQYIIFFECLLQNVHIYIFFFNCSTPQGVGRGYGIRKCIAVPDMMVPHKYIPHEEIRSYPALSTASNAYGNDDPYMSTNKLWTRFYLNTIIKTLCLLHFT